MERVIGFTGALALALLTMWIMIEGYRIMTGQSRTPLIGFVMQAGKMVVIISIATSSALYNEWVRDTLDDVRDDITYFITGSHQNVYRQVDKNLALTQTIMSSINSIATRVDTAGNNEDEKKRAWWMSAFGSGGPAIVAGMVSLLNEIMLSLAVVFGPIFILGLLFEQTKQLFWNWVKYCIGVMFSMGVLAIMTSITLKISIGYATAVAAAILSEALLGVGSGPSVSQTAMIQGGMGLMLTTLLITVPPMVMTFFSVSLGGAVSGFGPWASNTGAPPGTGMDNKNNNANSNSNSSTTVDTSSSDNGGVRPGGAASASSASSQSWHEAKAVRAIPGESTEQTAQRQAVANLRSNGLGITPSGNLYPLNAAVTTPAAIKFANEGRYANHPSVNTEQAREQQRAWRENMPSSA